MGLRPGFRGHAKPGAKTTLIGAVEYSLTREWVLALRRHPRSPPARPS